MELRSWSIPLIGQIQVFLILLTLNLFCHPTLIVHGLYPDYFSLFFKRLMRITIDPDKQMVLAVNGE